MSISEIEKWKHPELGPKGEELETLYLHLQRDPANLVISVSGTHGPEGLIGSEIQNRILESPIFRQEHGPSLLFVCTLNPFGKAWLRRGNHQNVDLNRNCWGEKPLQAPAEFDDYLDLLSSENTLEFGFNMIKKIPDLVSKGATGVSRILCEGQAHRPDSIFYCGTSRSPELSQLERKLKSLADGVQNVFVLDIHTGLGKSGEDTLINENAMDPSVFAKLESAFQGKILNLGEGAVTYKAQGTLSHLTTGCFPEAHVIHLTQEIGTRSSLTVLRNLILENSKWHKGERLQPERFHLLREAFYPDSKTWHDKALRLGVTRFQQLLGLF